MVPAAMISKETLRPFGEALVGPYVDYCLNVSRRGMAISIETATLFAYICSVKRAIRVLDLGSGFTSYVARCVGDVAVSVDDSQEWLDKTAEFLTRYKVSTDGLIMWDDWVTDPGGPYDVIIHDYSAGEKREAAMWDAAGVLAHDGVLIFDDAQHDGHRAEMFRVAEHHGLRVVNVQPVTEDEVHRFALMAVKA
jgi:predicted O-methyltransferase YrrM